jgi:PAS domain S-box-containing protein
MPSSSARLELEQRVEERTRDLQEAHTFRKAMEDSLLVGMRARDPEGRIIYVNPALCAMVGYSAEELAGAPPALPLLASGRSGKTQRESEDACRAGAAPMASNRVSATRTAMTSSPWSTPRR